jgi:hypothetical protein
MVRRLAVAAAAPAEARLGEGGYRFLAAKLGVISSTAAAAPCVVVSVPSALPGGRWNDTGTTRGKATKAY